MLFDNYLNLDGNGNDVIYKDIGNSQRHNMVVDEEKTKTLRDAIYQELLGKWKGGNALTQGERNWMKRRGYYDDWQSKYHAGATLGRQIGKNNVIRPYSEDMRTGGFKYIA